MKGSNLHTKEDFERAYGDRDWNWYRGLLAKSIRYGMPGTWLDLGAGLGLFVECARRFGIDCIGLEGSEYAVRIAKERFPTLDIRQHFLEDRLPFEDNSISTIVCNQVIEHIPKETGLFMLKESYRVLRQGGVILIYSPSKYNKKEKLARTHINLNTPSSLKRHLEDVGFKLINLHNSPRMVLGNWLIPRYIIKTLFKKFPLDFLSATANCIAAKPTRLESQNNRSVIKV